MFDPDRRHLIAYAAAAAVLVVIVVHWLGRDRGSDPVPSISMAAPAAANPAAARPRAAARAAAAVIWVDVAGAVRRPGLYSLPSGARIAAALERAGGATRHANRAAVNLAAKLADGQQVYVPRAGSGPGGAAAGSVMGGSAGGGSALGGSAGAGPAVGGQAAGAGIAPGQRISLSSASEAQLEQLDGIGPSLAQRIIQYRQQHGGFHSIDELQQVSGIGPKRFEALRDSIAP